MKAHARKQHLVGASGELELVGSLQVGIAGGAVGGGVILEVEKKGEHLRRAKEQVSYSSCHLASSCYA
jgi:hypothetical protein